MLSTRPDTPSVADRTRPVATGGAVIACISCATPRCSCSPRKPRLLVPPEGGVPQRIALHDGGILSVAGDGTRIVTGGDDGKVMEIGAARRDAHHIRRPEAQMDRSRRARAGRRDRMVGRQDRADANRKGEVKSLDLPSTAGGLAFLPKGFRLAIAHYNGASLWFPNAQAKPEFLEWKGSHLGVTVSPDGRFLVTTMQEPMLHGWRLVDSKHMRMSGYAARVRSFAWTADGAFLATGGSDQLILWPFSGKDGPMGKQPTMLAPHAQKACGRRMPSETAGGGRGLRGRPRAAGAARRRRRGARACVRSRHAGHRARLERRRAAARLCLRGPGRGCGRLGLTGFESQA